MHAILTVSDLGLHSLGDVVVERLLDSLAVRQLCVCDLAFDLLLDRGLFCDHLGVLVDVQLLVDAFYNLLLLLVPFYLLHCVLLKARSRTTCNLVLGGSMHLL